MDVSVVVPTRNRSALLATTLRSVLRQRCIDVEVIVVDDASDSDTSQLIEAFNDSRVRLIRHTVPLGPNAARNSGAREAQGVWLAFVDDDDIWAPDKLSSQLRAAEESGSHWVYAGSVNVNGQLEVIHGIPPLPPAEVMVALPRYNAIPASASNVIIRRNSFATHGGFNEQLRVCEEWDLWLRLAGAGPPAWVPSPLVGYRMHGGNATLDAAAIVEGARTIERLHGTALDWGRLHRWVAQLCIRGNRRTEAVHHYVRAWLRGAGREVRADLAGLAREALRRRLGARIASPRRRGNPAWEDKARAWVEELRELEVAGVDTWR